jgi:hypothetical protein
MRQDFTNIVQKLSIDTLTGVTIFDTYGLKFIEKGIYKDEVIKKYGSIKDFFEQIKQNGAKEISIQELRKNGSSFKKIGNPFTVNFSDRPQESQANQNNNSFGLNGATGLGFTDMVNLHVSANDKIRLQVENEAFKRELEEVKKQRDEYKEQILEDKYNSDKKNNNSQLIETLTATFGPVLAGLMQKPASSLNAPALPNLSDIKMHLFNLLQQNQISDSTVRVLLSVISKLDNSVFYENLRNIMQETQQQQTTQDNAE